MSPLTDQIQLATIQNMTRFTLRRLAMSIAVCIGIFTGSIVPQDETVKAYSIHGCKWPTGSVKYRIVNPPVPIAPLPIEASQGASAWNVTNSLRFSLVTNTTYQLSVTWNNYGNTGWSGVFTDSTLSLTWPPCTLGKWVNKEAWIVGNMYDLATYSSTWKKGVFAHEFGHAAGLKHSNAVNSLQCPSGYGPVALMYFADTRFSAECPVLLPKLDDINGANTIYP